MAEELLHDHADRLSGVTLVPSSGGVFEISLGERVIFSKRETGRFPEAQEIRPFLEGR